MAVSLIVMAVSLIVYAIIVLDALKLNTIIEALIISKFKRNRSMAIVANPESVAEAKKTAKAAGQKLMARAKQVAAAAANNTNAKKSGPDLPTTILPAILHEQLPLGLPQWADENWGMPNSFARGSLFTAMKSSNADREYYDGKTIASLSGINIEYRGQELRQDDYSVFLAILHFGRMYRLGEAVPFSAYSMLKELGWSLNSEEYVHLRECCARLSATNVTVTHDKGGSKGYAGSLLRSFAWKDEAGQQLSSWVVLLEPNIAQLFSGPTFTLINSAERKIIGGRSPLAQWLHSFLATHQKPLPISVNKYWELSASRNKDVNDFRRKIKIALSRLQEVGFLDNFTIRNDVVYVVRSPRSFKNPVGFNDTPQLNA